MRIAVMGTGAVGAYFGAKLAATAFHELAFIARGAHLEAMKKHGLTIKSYQGDLHVRDAVFSAEPAQVGTVDLVLFCVKSYDTDSAAPALAPLVGAQTIILSLQNGIDNTDKIARHWGEWRCLSGVVYVGAALASPGVIEHSTGGRIIFGNRDGSRGMATDLVEEALRASQIPYELSADIRQVQWHKLLWNTAFCAISSLTHATTQEIVESASLRQLAVDCMSEAHAAAATAGVNLRREAIEETLSFSRTLGHFKASMLQDLEAGKPLEYEAFNGIVIKQLESLGKAAPVNSVFYHALRFLDERVRRQKKG
jgi:2-dehydropantoate 2-reductase